MFNTEHKINVSQKTNVGYSLQKALKKKRNFSKQKPRR